MTKLFSRTFAISPEDVRIDQEISEKIHLLQSFLRPEHLDIPPFLQNEASWLVCVLAYFDTWEMLLHLYRCKTACFSSCEILREKRLIYST